jgi:hypothetical protein
MTDKRAVLGVLQRFPKNASLEEIVQELRIVAALRRGRTLPAPLAHPFPARTFNVTLRREAVSPPADGFRL